MKPQELLDLFYSNYSTNFDYEAIKEIYEILCAGYIKITKVEICAMGQFDKIMDKVLSGEIAICDYDGGGKKHIALKIIAGKYILKHFHQKCSYEVNFYGRRPDVTSKEKDIIFECGDTDPRKIMEYLEADENLTVFILPYHRTDDGDKLFAFDFVKNKDGLAAFLHNKKIDKLTDVRKIINARR